MLATHVYRPAIQRRLLGQTNWLPQKSAKIWVFKAKPYLTRPILRLQAQLFPFIMDLSSYNEVSVYS
jgi:hypothetical protein